MTSNLKISFNKREALADEEMLIYDYEDDDWKFEDEDNNDIEHDIQAGGVEDVEKQPVAIEGLESELFVDQTLSDETKHRAHVWNLDTKLGRIRFKIHLVMDHVAARLFSIGLVFLDIILVLIALATSGDTGIYSPITLAIVSYFMIELGLRMFSWGREFFHHRLEVVDMMIIILTFIVTVVFEIITLSYHARYGKLIVIFRLLRILLLARICTGQKHVKKATRNLISQNKRRYVKDGFDLDLTYITERVIAMSYPSSGKTSIYRNPIEEVSKFFNTKHPGHYKLYNLCSERHYDTSYFNDSVERVLIDDHNVARLSQLLQFCHSANDWMKQSDENVLVIHCKGGKGRTGLCVASWLLFSGQFKSAEKALHYFGLRRTDKAKGSRFQGVETPSQSRYVGYLETILKDMKGRLPQPRPLILRSLTITGITGVGNGDGSDLKMEVIVSSKVVFDLNFQVPVAAKITQKSQDALKVKINTEEFPIVSGDVKFKFYSSNDDVPEDYEDCAFFFWFHTSMIYNRKLHLHRNDIGNCHKKKTWKIYSEKFAITLKFNDPPKSATL